MTKPANTRNRAKKAEREVQQYLWPGTIFSGHAKRPALEDCDVRGEDRDGWPIWGEVKNYSPATTQSEGGPYMVLLKAYVQSQEAIERNPQDWPGDSSGKWAALGYPMRPHSFAVLWPKGSRIDEQRLVMYALPGREEPVVMTLAQFRAWVVGTPAEESAA